MFRKSEGRGLADRVVCVVFLRIDESCHVCVPGSQFDLLVTAFDGRAKSGAQRKHAGRLENEGPSVFLQCRWEKVGDKFLSLTATSAMAQAAEDSDQEQVVP